MINILNLVLISALTATAGYGQKLESLTAPSARDKDFSLELLERLDTSKGNLSQLQLTALSVLKDAFNQRKSNIQVLVSGRVVSVLPDDTKGSRHQRFVVKLANSQTLLIAHNIDLAPRVSNLKIGDQLYIYGEYEWSSKGGVIHWTHRDPRRIHVNGWIQKNGVMFQ